MDRPRWKLGSALHPLLARRLLTHSLRTIINTRGGRRVLAQQSNRNVVASPLASQRTNCVCSVSVATLKIPFWSLLGCDVPRSRGVPGRWHRHRLDRDHQAAVLSSGLPEDCFGGETLPGTNANISKAKRAGGVWPEKVG